MSIKTLLSLSIIVSICLTACNKHECPPPQPQTCELSSLKDGLVAYFPFNGNTNDSSSYKNNVIFNNATLTADRNNNPQGAYRFNGVDAYMRIANSEALNPALISLCAIVKPEGFNTAVFHASAIMYKGLQDQDVVNVYYLRFTDGPGSTNSNPTDPNVDTMHQAYFASFAGNSTPGAAPYVHTNTWYRLVYTYDGAIAKFYINGELVSSITSSLGYQPGNSDLFIGRTDNPPYPYWFNGVIDELRIYNRALTIEEVKSFGSSCSISK